MDKIKKNFQSMPQLGGKIKTHGLKKLCYNEIGEGLKQSYIKMLYLWTHLKPPNEGKFVWGGLWFL